MTCCLCLQEAAGDRPGCKRSEGEASWCVFASLSSPECIVVMLRMLRCNGSSLDFPDKLDPAAQSRIRSSKPRRVRASMCSTSCTKMKGTGSLGRATGKLNILMPAACHQVLQGHGCISRTVEYHAMHAASAGSVMHYNGAAVQGLDHEQMTVARQARLLQPGRTVPEGPLGWTRAAAADGLRFLDQGH